MILLIVDWQPSEYLSIEKEISNLNNYDDIYIWNCRKNKGTKLPIIYRYFEYIQAFFYVVKNYKKYEYIVSWQQIIGYLLVFFPIPKLHKKLIITSVLYSPDNTKNSFIKKNMLSRALKKSKALLYYSKDMANLTIDTYPQYKDKIFSTYIPILNSIITHDEPTVFNKIIDPNSTIFCGGQSDRDFESVILAFKGTNVPVIIVCPDQHQISNIHLATENIKILRFSQVSSSEYYRIAQKSFCILIPLKNENSSCGQLMFSYSMKNKKPIIATNCFGTRDYIKHNENGILVPVGDHKGMYEAYFKLKDNKKLKEGFIVKSLEIVNKMNFVNYLNQINKIINH